MEIHRKDLLNLMNRILAVRYENVELERELCEKLLESAKMEGYSYGIAFAYVYLVDCYLTQNDSLVCVTYLKEAMSLCEEYGYYDLLLQLQNFSGLYYFRVGDEQTALLSYLKGIDLARDQKNVMMESRMLNNIGMSFQEREDYETARAYYKQAYILIESDVKDIYNGAIYLANLAEIAQLAGDFEDSDYYLTLCQEMKVNSKLKNLRLGAGWCNHYAMSGNKEKALGYIKHLFDEGFDKFEDFYFVFETFLLLLDSMIQIRSQEYAKRCIDVLFSLYGGADLEFRYRFHGLNVRYHRVFQMDMRGSGVYKAYYEVCQQMKEMNNQVRIQSIHSTIELAQAVEEKESMDRENKKLEDASHLDDLTGLYNRRYFNKMISKIFTREKIGRVGFIMLDVDYFKQYNDHYGHIKGDEALCSVAESLRCYPESKVSAGRYGGDEFICICFNMIDEEVEAYILEVRQRLEQQQIEHCKSKCSHILTLSIGYCNEVVSDANESDLLLKLADQALYDTKQKGRNGYSCRQKVEVS